ncbi:protein of unknown function [Tepidanaerobacter acetatoxydans Re1]|uniref:Uncharacterized protein n=2 Tax=Tepidanaerobacter acetatoxydans TaxID=499229 RepID=L0RZH9_TEPAE|nr:protein of unknown function [Tepidanaerobacter acetatoxydans Re1]
MRLELAKERLDRIEAAINLEEPARVPCWGIGGEIVASYSGFTQYDLAYDPEKSLKAIEKFLKDFPFDTSMAGLAGLDGHYRPYLKRFQSIWRHQVLIVLY